MNTQDDFFEVNNEVPFKPIKHIRIESLQLQEQLIHIRVSMTLVGFPEADFL